jgi:hypothetical protein
MYFRKLLISSLLTLAGVGLLSAQEPAQDPNAPDPPSRVARLNYLSGTVSFRPGSIEEWAAATINYPLTGGDHLWTDQGSNAELHIGPAAIHMASETALAVLALDDRMAQVSVSQGALIVRLPSMEPDEAWEIDTPNGAITLLRPGAYRIDVNPQSNTTFLTVRAGDAEANAGGQAYTVHSRQMLRLVGADQVAGDVLASAPSDQWEDWCRDRDDKAERALQTAQSYVPPQMVGAEDLGQYGDWRNDPTYGPVWTPASVGPDWAPYRYGHWVYISPWGWTWVDDAPWGFAPFHYGRWVRAGWGWVWVPGARVRPVYAPALVAWVGGVGIAVGGGGGVAAWIPLGPREVYRPWYHYSPVYIRNVNYAHVTNVNITTINVTNVTYVNRTYVTAVPHETFVGARPVHTAIVRIPPAQINNIHIVNNINVQPARESYLGRAAQPGVRVVTPPAQAMARPIVVRHELPPQVRPAVPVRTVTPVRDAVRPQDNGRQFGRPPAETPVQPNVQQRQPQPQVQQQAQPRVQPQQPQVERPRPTFERPQQQVERPQSQPQQPQQQQQIQRPRPEDRPQQPVVRQQPQSQPVERPQPQVEHPHPQPPPERHVEQQQRQEQHQQQREEKHEQKDDRKKQ